MQIPIFTHKIIYTYCLYRDFIYMCVCVCVCVNTVTFYSLPMNQLKRK